MSKLQNQLYDALIEKSAKLRLLATASYCRKILNHPDLLLSTDVDETDDLDGALETDEKKYDDTDMKQKNKSWFLEYMDPKIYHKNLLQNSPKMEILLSILSDCFAAGDKMVVFSLSKGTLTLIEHHIKTELKLIPDWTYSRKTIGTTAYLVTFA